MALIIDTRMIIKKNFRLLKIIPILCILILVLSVSAGASSDRFVDVSCGIAHVIALSENGVVWEWGRMYEQAPDPLSFNGTMGQQINNTHMRMDAYVISHDQLTPIKVPIDNVTAIATGDVFSLALKRDGTVWAWGNNEFGVLGDGTNISTSTPVQVKGLEEVVDISTGGEHSIAIKKDGTVWAWGLNSLGQLGDGTRIAKRAPVQITELTNVKAIYCGSFAIKDDGTVWTWGPTIKDANRAVQEWAGNVTFDEIDTKPTPYQILNLKNITYVDMDHGFSHTILVEDDGTVWCWGYDLKGQLGNGKYANNDPHYISVPVQVKGLINVKKVQAGMGQSSMALKNDGTVWAWGRNGGGQLGLGDISIDNPAINPLPVEVKSIKGVKEISSKTMVSAFLTSDGSIWTVGEDYAGQIGDGSKKADTAVTIPVKVLGPNSDTSSITGLISLPQGDYSSVIPVIGAFMVVITIGCAVYLLFTKKRKDN